MSIVYDWTLDKESNIPLEVNILGVWIDMLYMNVDKCLVIYILIILKTMMLAYPHNIIVVPMFNKRSA